LCLYSKRFGQGLLSVEASNLPWTFSDERLLVVCKKKDQVGEVTIGVIYSCHFKSREQIIRDCRPYLTCPTYHKFFFFALILSLSLTHTHTQTHTYTFDTDTKSLSRMCISSLISCWHECTHFNEQQPRKKSGVCSLAI
jgi:hypothetical protein